MAVCMLESCVKCVDAGLHPTTITDMLRPQNGASSAPTDDDELSSLSCLYTPYYRLDIPPLLPSSWMTLWSSTAVETWLDALASYPEAVKAQQKARLVDLDRFASSS